MTRISSVAVGSILLLSGASAFVPNHPNQRLISVGTIGSSGSVLYAANDNKNGDDSNGFGKNIFESIKHTAAVSALALGLTFTSLSASPLPAMATDSGAIVSCLFSKCQLPLAKCIANPKCLANVVCINTCNGRDDEIECQIKCGDLFENEVVGEFNKCVVSDMACVPQKPDDGLYPVPAPEALVPKFDTKLWNGKWYITSGQNELFDVRDFRFVQWREMESLSDMDIDFMESIKLRSSVLFELLIIVSDPALFFFNPNTDLPVPGSFLHGDGSW